MHSGPLPACHAQGLAGQTRSRGMATPTALLLLFAANQFHQVIQLLGNQIDDVVQSKDALQCRFITPRNHDLAIAEFAH